MSDQNYQSGNQQPYQSGNQQPYQSVGQQPYQSQYQQPQVNPYAQQGQYQSGNAAGSTQPFGQQDYAQRAYAQGSRAESAAESPVEKKAKSSDGKTFAMGFAGAAVACALVFGGLSVTGNLGTKTVLGGSGSTAITATSEASGLAEQVAEKCLPSVVSIDVYTKQSNSGYYGMFGGMGGSSSSDELTQSSLGSGVVISEDGYIITNYHVIEGASALKVTAGGAQYDAAVVGSDSSSDIAVVKITNANGQKFTAIDLGDSDNLTIGEWVMTIGSPFGLEQSVATGIVSATNRSQIYSDSSSTGSSSGSTIYTNLIQTDAAINPGNSGGALVNARGQLIGINTLITSYSGNYSGVGFAIPVNYAVDLAQQIIEGKTPTHAQLGVSTTSITSSIAQRYGFSVDKGAYVSSVSSGSGAEAAGIMVGDIITSIDGKTIESASDVQLAVRSKNVGDTISITVNRDGKTETMTATLGSDSASATTKQGSLFGGSNQQ